MPERSAPAPLPYDAVLLLGFGGPEGQDDVIPFLRNVTSGRGIPEARLETVGAHYRAFDGVSPVNAQNRALRAALEAGLIARDCALPVYWGNRNWTPYLQDAVTEASLAGYTRLLCITTSAYSSYSSCRQYREDLALVLAAPDPGGAVLSDSMRIDVVRPYFDHPGFVTPFIQGVGAALARLAAGGIPVEATQVLFTTHSIPLRDANLSGTPARGFGDGGAYLAQHRAVATAVMAALGSSAAFSLVFQSRSGPPGMPWLEPDINDAITGLAADGVRAVVVVPIGFISDHMEVRWDLDTEAAATAAALGLAFERVPTPGVHPAFVAGLVDLVLERIHAADAPERPALTALGPWADACPAGCCAKASGANRSGAAESSPNSGRPAGPISAIGRART